jgi:A/G-specific adenine glycosylase
VILRRAQDSLLSWYERHGRTSLPWRRVRDPYYTLVSEFMLQQTQVDRVVPKFEAFVAHFPDVVALADAGVGDVLREWQGLGYNSRAVRLHETAGMVVERFGGSMPSETHLLRQLPGVGPYTAAAIRAFGFDLEDAPVDTNIRRIVHRVAFGVEHPPKASPRDLDTRARDFIPAGSSHDWNSAMMDLGATICTARAPKCLICPLREHCAAAPVDAASLESARREHAKSPSPQNAIPWERTTRFARGRIVERLRALPPGQRISLLDLHGDLQPLMPERSLEDVTGLVAILERDGLVARDGETVALRD